MEQLQQRIAELEKANRELRFVAHYHSLSLARMSHELRTPLTSILGFSEILLDQEKLTETQHRFCQKIQNSGMQLLMSLNQLVDLSRLEVGASEIYSQEFALYETLRESAAAVTRLAQKQGVTLQYDLAPEITTIVSDQGRLRHIIYTFLAWTIRRSREGQVVKLYVEEIAGPALRIQIDDEGEPVNDMLRLFDLEETSPTCKTDLNELEIIIGKRLVEVIKGNVTLENRKSGLRTFIQIPIGQPKT